MSLRTSLYLAAALLSCCLLTLPALAQQPQDPEDDKKLGLWLDQTISAGLSPNSSLEFEIHERFDQGISQLYEYFFQGGVAFRPRPWLTLIPIYRYQRYPIGSTTSYENRGQLNITLSAARGRWRPIFRTLFEGRFPENRIASARLRFRPGIEYTVPLRWARPPVLIVSNEFFFVPGTNSFPGGGFTQNRAQVGVRVPMTDSCSIRPYYLLQSVDLPSGWKTNRILGSSIGFRFY